MSKCFCFRDKKRKLAGEMLIRSVWWEGCGKKGLITSFASMFLCHIICALMELSCSLSKDAVPCRKPSASNVIIQYLPLQLSSVETISCN